MQWILVLIDSLGELAFVLSAHPAREQIENRRGMLCPWKESELGSFQCFCTAHEILGYFFTTLKKRKIREFWQFPISSLFHWHFLGPISCQTVHVHWQQLRFGTPVSNKSWRCLFDSHLALCSVPPTVGAQRPFKREIKRDDWGKGSSGEKREKTHPVSPAKLNEISHLSMS